MKVYFVRHGQTDWNANFKLQGVSDIELNEIGIEQAHEAQKKLSDKKVDLIICSPLKRTRKTAEIINHNRNIPIIYDERIIERNFGIYEGTPCDDFDYEAFWDYYKNLQYEKEGVENIKIFFDRIYGFLDEIKQEYADKTVLIVAHSGIGRPLNCYSKGMPEDGKLVGMRTKNCEVAEFDIN